ncbi:MAG: hypothetical protein HRU38_17180 [Saccharospirillaceae bacterium]|nr:hypothetical protein [Pseudomonadales bacterium]NRB80372.1 hypothetical protein [Saccharospirillaceae bacterium]
MLQYGKVVKYFDNGFGFIKCLDTESKSFNKEVFFHIKVVKKFENDLVEFSNGSISDLYFWFTSKDGKKGKEVVEFWSDAKDIPQEHTLFILEKYADTLIEKSKDTNKVLTYSVSTRAINRIVQNNTVNPVHSTNKIIINALSLAIKHSLTSVQSEELSLLISDMSEKNFRLSSELSKYITSNKLGNVYPNIAGIVRMSNDENEWNFDGGFSTGLYRIICEELQLTDKGTSARAIKFTSYQDKKLNSDIVF